MNKCAGPTIAGFNKYVEDQRKTAGACKMSLTKFQEGCLHIPYEGLDLSFVPPMTTSTFVPGGSTNLYDAIGDRLESLAVLLEQWTDKPDILFVVMTDGEDNMSWQYTPQRISALISQYREMGWGFAYLGANQNASYVGAQMGFRPAECKTFDTAKMSETMDDLSTATTVYRAATMAGQTTEIFR
jgi:hypothetical protein